MYQTIGTGHAAEEVHDVSDFSRSRLLDLALKNQVPNCVEYGRHNMDEFPSVFPNMQQHAADAVANLLKRKVAGFS